MTYYDSERSASAGSAVVGILLIAYAMGGVVALKHGRQTRQEYQERPGIAAEAEGKTEPALTLGDLNGNGVPDKYYVDDRGKTVVVELDGHPVPEPLETRVQDPNKR